MCAISTADQMDQEATSSDDDDVFSDGSSYIDFEKLHSQINNCLIFCFSEYSSSDEQNTVEECEEDDSNHAISNSTNGNYFIAPTTDSLRLCQIII
jgi:hemerythrin-like domain-containing protein